MTSLLIKPDLEYKASYIEALREAIKESSFPEHYEAQIQDIEQYIVHMEKVAQGEDLTSGEVKRSEFWLIDDKRYIGKIFIRHKPSGRTSLIASHIYYEIRPSERGKGYGVEILKQGLSQAKNLGLSEIIITCSKDNIPSKLIIERNGGIFMEEISIPGDAVPFLKYRIIP
jgi:predicted acetyltransferase